MWANRDTKLCRHQQYNDYFVQAAKPGQAAHVTYGFIDIPHLVASIKGAQRLGANLLEERIGWPAL
jgi:hypothetical protein